MCDNPLGGITHNVCNPLCVNAGVFAVRAGPPLTANLRRVLEGNYVALEDFVPQKTFLGIIGTGRTHSAVASKVQN